MRILYIVDFNASILVRQIYQDYLKYSPDSQINILDFFTGRLFSSEKLLSRSPRPSRQKGILQRIMFLYGSAKSTLLLLFSAKYQIIHLHYLNPYYRVFLPVIRIRAVRFITSVYGSDFYNHSEKRYKWIRPVLEQSDVITFSNPQMKTDFSGQFPDLQSKTVVCRFGLILLDKIDSIRGQHGLARSAFGLPTDRMIICCGHSANRRELHRVIIGQLSLLDPETRKKYLWSSRLPITSKPDC